MKAVIRVDVPKFQIGKPATIFFQDTICRKAVCEADEMETQEYKSELINLMNRAKRDLSETEYAELVQLASEIVQANQIP